MLFYANNDHFRLGGLAGIVAPLDGGGLALAKYSNRREPL